MRAILKVTLKVVVIYLTKESRDIAKSVAMVILGAVQLLAKILAETTTGGGVTTGHRIMAHGLIIKVMNMAPGGIILGVNPMILGNSCLKNMHSLENSPEYRNRSPTSDYSTIRDEKRRKNSKSMVQIEPMYANIYTPEKQEHMLYSRSIEY